MIDFYVGQKVVCVDAQQHDHIRFSKYMHGLKEGEIYTIRWIGRNPQSYIKMHPDCDHLVVCIEEIIRPVCPNHNVEIGFRASRFRPLIHTDISVFTAMLAPTPKVRERERVDV